MTSKVYIYGLLCPIEDKFRYVGRSNNPARRYKEHVPHALTSRDMYFLIFKKEFIPKHPKTRWIFDLADQQLQPTLIILDEAEDGSNGRLLELEWLNALLALGHPLTNVRFERNKSEPHFSTIHKLADALEVDATELIR